MTGRAARLLMSTAQCELGLPAMVEFDLFPVIESMALDAFFAVRGAMYIVVAMAVHTLCRRFLVAMSRMAQQARRFAVLSVQCKFRFSVIEIRDAPGFLSVALRAVFS